jgi:hypothetical protein
MKTEQPIFQPRYEHRIRATATFLFLVVLLTKIIGTYVGTGSLERELRMVQLSATKCSCITVL